MVNHKIILTETETDEFIKNATPFKASDIEFAIQTVLLKNNVDLKDFIRTDIFFPAGYIDLQTRHQIHKSGSNYYSSYSKNIIINDETKRQFIIEIFLDPEVFPVQFDKIKKEINNSDITEFIEKDPTFPLSYQQILDLNILFNKLNKIN